MREPDVGIVIRTKDRPLLLERALRGILAQTFENWQVRIVNDGGKAAVVDELVERYRDEAKGRVQVLHNRESRGMQNASNQGIDALQTRYLIIHDDDDSLEPRFLEECMHFLEFPPHPRFKGVITHATRVVETVEDGEVKEQERHPFNEWLVDVSLFRMLEQNTFPPISFVFSRDAYNRVGPFVQEWNPLGDWEFNVRFLLQYDIGVIPKPLSNYHHRASATGDQSYINSVNAGNQHLFHETLLRNQWLRDDLKQGSWGLGVISNVSAHLGTMLRNQWTLMGKQEHMETALRNLHSGQGNLGGSMGQFGQALHDFHGRLAELTNQMQDLQKAVRESERARQRPAEVSGKPQ